MYMRFHARDAVNTGRLKYSEDNKEYCLILRGTDTSFLPGEGCILNTGFIPLGTLDVGPTLLLQQQTEDIKWAGRQVDEFFHPTKPSGNSGSFVVISVSLVAEKHITAFLKQFIAVKQLMKASGELTSQQLFKQKKRPNTEFCNVTFWESPAGFIRALSSKQFNNTMRTSYDVSGATQVYFFYVE
ncbi:hypothetical protein ACIQCT_22855 [Enterobacter cancerogenus]|uniref:hypothetical protein n=1 Tax=Enterobacter cancerogenus TaxID=69218 RepID=UPI00381CFF07